MNVKKLLFGLGTGIVAGAATVLFTTPQSGNELRLSIKERKDTSLDVKNEFQQRFQTIKDSIDTIKSEIKETVPSVVEDLKESVEDFQQQTASNQEKIQEHVAGLQQIATDITTEIETLQKSK
ncbi:MAG: YtxH domain-containing protein [Kurthia sp.]|nr:YtxH domain-containing protein [Candidatus Kurthia equi]